MLSLPTNQNTYRISALFIILILIGVQWGFYESYTSHFPTFENATPVIHIHGALLMIWLTLLVVQPMLIYFKKAKLHRTIGKSAFVLGPLIIISMFLVGRGGYWRGLANEVPEVFNLGVMTLDIRGLVSFTIFWALAMAYRKIPFAHMRYMIATGILAIGPGMGRGLIASFNLSPIIALSITDALELAIVGTLLGIDLIKKNDFKPFLVVFLVLLTGKILFQLHDTELWQNFAQGYADLLYWK
jgi:hypothetical protein